MFNCDLCKQEGITREAKYDGKTIYGSWANMCEECYKEFGAGLGTGKGQELPKRFPVTSPSSLKYTITLKEFEEGAMEGLMHIKCPQCKEKTPAEPDATGTYCQSCDSHIALANPYF